MLPAYGLYTHIRANEMRSRALIGGLFGLVLVLAVAGALLGAAWTHAGGTTAEVLRSAGRTLWLTVPLCVAVTGLWVWFAMRHNAGLIAMTVGARDVERAEQPRLYDRLEALCISRGLPTPRLAILDSPVLNAFASGVNDPQYTITVTTGLLAALDDAELDAVLAHELTHVRNGDVRLMVIAGLVAGIVSFTAEIVFRMLRANVFPDGLGRSRKSSSSDRKGNGAAVAVVIALVLIAIAWLLSLVIRLALSRTREFLADAGAVELTKDPDALIRALRKIDGKGEIPSAPSGLMELCFDNPRSGFADLFSTHPSIEARVETLKRMAGGRETEPPPLRVPAAPASPWGAGPAP